MKVEQLAGVRLAEILPDAVLLEPKDDNALTENWPGYRSALKGRKRLQEEGRIQRKGWTKKGRVLSLSSL